VGKKIKNNDVNRFWENGINGKTRSYALISPMCSQLAGKGTFQLLQVVFIMSGHDGEEILNAHSPALPSTWIPPLR
jgi:hypothetical protein